MGLEQIRNCSIQYVICEHGEKCVRISGVCKMSGKYHYVQIPREQYEKWKENSWPLSISFPQLTATEIRFLSTGVWKDGSKS